MIAKRENPSLLIDLILKECILLHLRKEQMLSYLYSKLIYPYKKFLHYVKKNIRYNCNSLQ